MTGNSLIKSNNQNIAINDKPSLPAIALNIKGISTRSKDTYYFNMISYENFCKKNNIEIGIKSADKWIKSAGTSKSQQSRYGSIRKVLRELYGKSTKWVELEDKLKDIKISKSSKAKKRTDYLDKKQIDCLIENSPKKWALFIKVAFETGARCEELCSIKLSDCNIVENDAVHAILREAKGNQEYTVFINPKTFNDCKNFYKGNIYLFEHNGKKYNRCHVTRVISMLSESILGVKASAHTFRHSKAMYLKDVLSFSPDQVQKALHHKNVSTTLENYYHGEPSAKDQGII